MSILRFWKVRTVCDEASILHLSDQQGRINLDASPLSASVPSYPVAPCQYETTKKLWASNALVSLSEQLRFRSIFQLKERMRAQQHKAMRQAEHLFQTMLHRALSPRPGR